MLEIRSAPIKCQQSSTYCELCSLKQRTARKNIPKFTLQTKQHQITSWGLMPPGHPISLAWHPQCWGQKPAEAGAGSAWKSHICSLLFTSPARSQRLRDHFYLCTLAIIKHKCFAIIALPSLGFMHEPGHGDLWLKFWDGKYLCSPEGKFAPSFYISGSF